MSEPHEAIGWYLIDCVTAGPDPDVRPVRRDEDGEIETQSCANSFDF